MRKSRWIVIMVLALVVGILFRFGDSTGIGLFRMFGTMAIGIIGIYTVLTFTRWQGDSAVHELKERLHALPKTKMYQAPKELRNRFVRAETLIERDGTYFLLATSNIPNFRGRRHRRRVQAAVYQLAQWGGGFDNNEFGRILVLLRRRIREDEQQFAKQHGVVLVNAEMIDDAVLVTSEQLMPAS